MQEIYAFEHLYAKKTEDTLCEISKRIFEMDANSCGFFTIPLKQYMSDSFDADGKFNYNRLHQLEKLVNEIYYGPFQRETEMKAAQKNQFSLLYEKEGVIGQITFERLNETTWRTSEIGRWAYDSTHRAFPSWLLHYTLLGKPKVSSVHYDKPYGEKNTTVHAILCGIEATITLKRRRHENGIIYGITLTFQNQADADRFTHILNEKQQDNVRIEKKCRLEGIKTWGMENSK